MAQTGLDNNAITVSDEEDVHIPRNSRITAPTRSEKPLFAARKPAGIYFGKTTTVEAENSPTRPVRPGSGSWLSGNGGKGITLGEAFQRTDEKGIINPKSQQSNTRVSGREGSLPESRIPRSRTFSPDAGVSPSPTRNLKDEYGLAKREERSSSAPVALTDGSPSPAPRPRRQNRIETRSNVSGSGSVGGLSEDELDSKLNQFAKDQERVTAMLGKQTGLFSKADVGSRDSEPTRSLARKSSASSLESEPPVRPPRTWGTKAKKNGDWMSRILSPDSSFEIKNPPPVQTANQVSSDLPGSIADFPLPSIEDGSSIQEPTPPSSRPTSAQPRNISPEKSKLWDAELDFTAQSLQLVTSPQLRVRSKKLEEIRDREFESLTARAVARNRLEEIKERNSEERSIVTESSLPITKDSGRKEERPEHDVHDRTILEAEGERIHGTPITIFSGSSFTVGGEQSSRQRKPNHDKEGNPGISDSRDVLRRLSRATSSSPGPGLARPEKAKERPTISESEKAIIEQPDKLVEHVDDSSRRPGLDVDPSTKRYSATSSPPKSDADPEERIAAEASLFELPDYKSERNSIREPSPPSSEGGKIEDTPRPKPNPLLMPTPKVIGAYIDTPEPSTRKRRESRSVSPAHDVDTVVDDKVSAPEVHGLERKESSGQNRNGTSANPQLSLPKRQARPLINTANPTTASEDLRRIQKEAQIEDSTLDDFDAFLEDNAGVTVDTVNKTSILEPILGHESDARGMPLSDKEIERRLERLALDRINKSLKNTSSSIRDARHGIERLEQQVSSSSSSRVIEQPDLGQYIKIPLPRLWTTSPAKGPGRRRSWMFTWLGLLLSLLFIWDISESVMCSMFCHPKESSVNTWQPTDPFFPYAIPTKLDQWTGHIVSNTASNAWNVLGNGNLRKRKKYKSGPLGASDWWLGRDGPVGVVKDGVASIFNDEMIL